MEMIRKEDMRGLQQRTWESRGEEGSCSDQLPSGGGRLGEMGTDPIKGKIQILGHMEQGDRGSCQPPLIS